LARIQSGRFTLHRQSIKPEVLAQNTLEALQHLFHEKEVSILRNFSPAPPVNADPERIAIVLSNLLSNALRYSKEKDNIRLRIAEEKQTVRFEICDEGPGIPEEMQASIFEKYTQLPGSQGATGLGLFLAREIIKAHGGEIGVNSKPGEGATFWFTLPIQRE
jgi:signal transduction histidine kinase